MARLGIDTPEKAQALQRVIENQSDVQNWLVQVVSQRVKRTANEKTRTGPGFSLCPRVYPSCFRTSCL